MSEVKVNKISPRTNCGTVTVGDSGDSVSVSAGVPVTVNGDLKSNALKATDGGSIISQCGTTITLGASGDTINLAAGASQSGFGRTGTVNWDTTPKTSTVTAESGVGYFVDTTSASVTVNLPAGTAGAIVAVADYANTADTNKIVVNANGSEKIQGIASNPFEITVEGGSVTLVYVDSTQGWRPTDASTAASITENSAFICASVSGACNTLVTAPCCSNVKIATFLGPGTFTVNSGAGPVANVDYLVIAGGGGGGSTALPPSSHGGSGGGAGGYRFTTGTQTGCYTAAPAPLAPLGAASIRVTPGAFPITVGGGGAGLAAQADPSTATPGGNGNPSVFSTIIATAGGGGATRACTPPGVGGTNGAPGGSGGGGNTGSTAGSGNTPPVSPPQGNDGGSCGQRGSPGGGGIGAVGGVGEPSGAGGAGGDGGNGASSSITGSSVARGGGGGGSGTPAPGLGASGGGDGGYPPTNATSATANTGSGGGGGTRATCGSPSSTGGNGGSGVVIIRYKFQ
jgi:hypothetical protein